MAAFASSQERRALSRRLGLGSIALFIGFCLLGVLMVHYLGYVLGLFAVAAVIGLCRLCLVYLRRSGLEIWRILLLIALTGYLLLNYGFENLTIHVGFPFIVSYGLMYACVILAVFSQPRVAAIALKEPAVLCLLALLLSAGLHLVMDIPQYGIWAIRDATMFIDGIFMLLGFLWVTKRNSITVLVHWLMVLFFVNMLYSFTLPWGDASLGGTLWSWSPKSGVFFPVPILGNYHNSPIVLLSGGLFYLYFAGHFSKRSRWIVLFLGMVQVLGLAVVQARQMYVGLAVILIVLILTGEAAKFGKLLFILASAVLIVFLVTAIGGVELTGRVGPINMEFFKEHIRSISGAEHTPGSTVQSRIDWYEEAFRHVEAHPLVGEGFGEPLINYIADESGAAVRQPHNSTLNLLARLGITGLIFWIAFHICIIRRFAYAFSRRRYCSPQLYDFILWLFSWYLLFMIVSWVDAPFEFPEGAIPFYFFVGVFLGLIRWQIPEIELSAQKSRAAGIRAGATTMAATNRPA